LAVTEQRRVIWQSFTSVFVQKLHCKPMGRGAGVLVVNVY